MKDYLVAHDLGTTGDKATLFSADGRMIRSITQSYPIYYGENGAVEQDPDEWWQVVCQTTGKLLEGEDKSRVAAISFAGQMMGCTCVDEKGNALRRSIIWADTRSVEQADQLAESYGRDKFYYTTGFKLNPSYTVTKFMWVKQYEPEIYKKTYKTLFCKDYIVLKLTGR
ncbi:MAG: xylulokinase, partial [Christensenellaceae bacterium]|nr:xylulokinase [Christensenellaceae bacterium]